jgi:CubicO group peptidase (beta-lactamase class C family)
LRSKSAIASAPHSASPDVLDYVRKHSLHALVIAREGRVIEEAYGDGYDGSTPHALYSGTKSFWGVAAVAAQRDGILRLDERVAETFRQWDADEWKRRVTLRHLLQLTSGIGFGGLGSAVPTYAKALAVDLKSEPGSRFTYGGIPLQVFGAVFARKLEPRKQTPHEYLRARILDPIGMRIARWRTLADGSNPLPTGAFISAREWLKYGQFVREHREEYAECFQGSDANARYGLGWWLAPPTAPSDLFYASGAGGQAMYVIPSRQTVVVHFGNSSSYKHDAFLKRFLTPTLW